MPLKGVNLLFQSKRSSLTCTYKCGNACAGEAPNHSDNAYFGDIMSVVALSRSWAPAQ